MDDRELLARLRAGDQAAFDALFRAWYAPLVRQAERLVGARAAAEEIVQDALLELWRRRETLDPAGTAQAYLFQTVRNRAYNALRHARVADRAAPQLTVEATARPAPAPDAEVSTGELEAAIAEAVASLPPRCREVFTLSRANGLTYAEIAGALGVSVKAVEAQMGRALRTLRERLAPWLPGGDAL